MGLDMYLYKRTKDMKEIGYWRKFNALQNYIEQNFGNGEEINCKEIPLTKENIKDLLIILNKVNNNHDLAQELLPNTTGFFYGSQEYDSFYFQDIEESIEIFTNALKEADENDIIYSCWY